MESINNSYRVESEEERLIRDLFDWQQPVEEWKEYTATQIAEMIGHNISPVKVGKALRNVTLSGVECRIKDGISIYLMPRKKPYVF